MDIKGNKALVSKRKFFRVYVNVPICTEVSIIKLDNKRVKTRSSFICVKDIGLGGLRFSSRLKFPMGDTIVYQFKLPILGKNYYINGNIVWSREQQNKEIHYGVNFLIENSDDFNYFSLFNNLALMIKRKTRDHGCKFCDPSECPNRY